MGERRLFDPLRKFSTLGFSIPHLALVTVQGVRGCRYGQHYKGLRALGQRRSPSIPPTVTAVTPGTFSNKSHSEVLSCNSVCLGSRIDINTFVQRRKETCDWHEDERNRAEVFAKQEQTTACSARGLPCGNNPFSLTMPRRPKKHSASHQKSSAPSFDRSKGKMKPWNTVDDIPLDEEDECAFTSTRFPYAYTD